jgi:hypothetical protein
MHITMFTSGVSVFILCPVVLLLNYLSLCVYSHSCRVCEFIVVVPG